SCSRKKYEYTSGHRHFRAAAPRIRHVRSGVVGQQFAARDRDFDVHDTDRDILLPATEFCSLAAAGGPTHGDAQSIAATGLRHFEHVFVSAELRSNDPD